MSQELVQGMYHLLFRTKFNQDKLNGSLVLKNIFIGREDENNELFVRLHHFSFSQSPWSLDFYRYFNFQLTYNRCFSLNIQVFKYNIFLAPIQLIPLTPNICCLLAIDLPYILHEIKTFQINLEIVETLFSTL